MAQESVGDTILPVLLRILIFYYSYYLTLQNQARQTGAV